MDEIPSLEKMVQVAEKKTPANVTRLANGLTNGEELFCQAMVKHGDQLRAVQEAGFTVTSPKKGKTYAWKLLQKDKIKKRIDDLKAQTAMRNGVTTDLVVKMVLDTYHAAMAGGRFEAANQASKMLGEYMDIFKAKPASVVNVTNITDSNVFDKELKRLASAAGVPLLIEGVKDAEFEEVEPDSGDVGEVLRDAEDDPPFQQMETALG